MCWRRAAAEVDQSVALDAEAPKVQLGRTRAVREPLFLFPLAGPAPEVEWKTQSARKYHGRLANLAADLVNARDGNTKALLVMPSLGVAERVTEILAEYEIAAQLSLVEQMSESAEATEATGLGAAQTIVTVGRLSSGFEMPGARLLTHVEADLFDEAGDQAPERRGPWAEGRGRRQRAGKGNQRQRRSCRTSAI